MPHALHDVFASLGRWLAGVFFFVAASTSAFAATAQYYILLDTDNNAATGCTLNSGSNSFTGIERVLTTTVDVTPTSSNVTGVTVESCVGTVLGAVRPVSSASWPVGNFVPAPQANPLAVIETFLPLAELGPTATSVRASILAQMPGGEDALLDANLIIQRAAPATVAAVPTLSPLVLALLAAGIGLAGAWLVRRHQASFMVLGMCVLLSASGMAWAATILMDGQTGDWSGSQPRLSGNINNPNLVNLWFTQDAQNAYFRIDACKRIDDLPGEMRQEAAGDPMQYTTRGGRWTIKVDASTITVTRTTHCQGATVETWGHPHENLNGKHIKDWLTDRRSLLLDDGTKITMHADGPQQVVRLMSIYDGPNSFEIDNDNNTISHQSTDLTVAQQRDEGEADGETAHVKLVPDSAPGALGHVDFRNIYTQDNPGPAPQCLTGPLDPLCVEVPLGTTGDFYLNPNQVNDLFDDPRLAHT